MWRPHHKYLSIYSLYLFIYNNAQTEESNKKLSKRLNISQIMEKQKIQKNTKKKKND